MGELSREPTRVAVGSASGGSRLPAASPPPAPSARRQLYVAALGVLVGLAAALFTVHVTGLEMESFHRLTSEDHWAEIQLGILATFLGFGTAFAVARTLRRRLSRAAYLALSLPLMAAGGAYCALLPAAVVWLIAQLPP